MVSSAAPVIERASLFILATYVRNRISEVLLENWQQAGSANDLRRVESVHDWYSVLQKLDAPDDTTVDDLKALLASCQTCPLPDAELLGQTKLLMVQTPIPSDVRGHGISSLAAAVFGASYTQGCTEPPCMSANPTDENELLIECSADYSAWMTSQIYSSFRLLETFRHKVLGQFAGYQQHYRQTLLQAGTELRSRLEQFNSGCSPSALRNDVAPGSGNSTVSQAQRVTEAYSRALLIQGPVQQIKTMLEANLRNIQQLSQTESRGPDDVVFPLLPTRYGGLSMLLAQVEADLGLILPILEAAQCVAQTYHGQLLAELAASEARENRQRSRDGDRRDVQNLWLTVLGIWLGFNQVWSGGLALLPEADRPAGWWLIFWLLGPTVLCAVGGVLVMLSWRLAVYSAKQSQRAHRLSQAK